MTAKISHFRLGIFVVAALVLLVALVISVGGGNAFRPKVRVETYFSESVQGLDIGSKVRYRGVIIGAVSRISFTYTKYEQHKAPADRKQYVLVEMDVYPDLLGDVGGGRQFVDQLVADGLRIRMAPIGVTGIVYLELDFSRDSPLLPVNWVPDNLYIPSKRSTVVSFVDAAERVISKLEGLDIGGTANNLGNLLEKLNRKVEALDTEGVSREVTLALGDLRRTLQDVNQITGREEWKKVPADLATTVRRLREIADSPELERTLAALDRSAQRVDHALAGREQDISELIVNLRAASGNLRALSDNLRRDPAGTLLAKPPKPSDAYLPR